jgi:transcriptional regulator with XRE-family HTH domain
MADLSGAELRDRIKALGLSHEDAAWRLGVSMSSLYSQINGNREVSRRTLATLRLLEEIARLTDGCQPAVDDPARDPDARLVEEAPSAAEKLHGASLVDKI